VDIVIIESNELNRALLIHLFQSVGHHVHNSFPSGELLSHIVEARPDLLLVAERALPNALELCQRVHSELPQTVVVVLGSRSSEEEECSYLLAGADDYVAMPFSPGVLLARCEAHRRRGLVKIEGSESSVLHLGAIRIYPNGLVRNNGHTVKLSGREFALLYALARRGGRVATREELLKECWGKSFDVATNEVDVYINRLRRKLGNCVVTDGSGPAKDILIETVRGQGYRLALGKIKAQ